MDSMRPLNSKKILIMNFYSTSINKKINTDKNPSITLKDWSRKPLKMLIKESKKLRKIEEITQEHHFCLLLFIKV